MVPLRHKPQEDDDDDDDDDDDVIHVAPKPKLTKTSRAVQLLLYILFVVNNWLYIEKICPFVFMYVGLKFLNLRYDIYI